MRHDEAQIINDQPGRYYVTVRNDAGAVRFLLGPYATHLEALENERRGYTLAMNSGDPHAPWYRYGTSRLKDDTATVSAIFGR